MPECNLTPIEIGGCNPMIEKDQIHFIGIRYFDGVKCLELSGDLFAIDDLVIDHVSENQLTLKRLSIPAQKITLQGDIQELVDELQNKSA